MFPRATFPSKVFYGTNVFNSFKMARRNILPILGLPKSHISADMIATHDEQHAHKALWKLGNSKLPRSFRKEDVPIAIEVYCFNKSPRFEAWHKGSVRSTEDHI